MKAIFLWIPVLFFTYGTVLQSGERIVFGDEKLSVELPDGWKKSERNPGTTMIGWESPDQTASAYFQKMDVGVNRSMSEILDDIVDNYDQNEGMVFKKVEKYKTGQVNGPDKKWPAIFTTINMTLKASPKDFEMKFYLFVFDTGTAQYFIQASSTRPIWDVREKQILSLIRSIIARR